LGEKERPQSIHVTAKVSSNRRRKEGTLQNKLVEMVKQKNSIDLREERTFRRGFIGGGGWAGNRGKRRNLLLRARPKGALRSSSKKGQTEISTRFRRGAAETTEGTVYKPGDPGRRRKPSPCGGEICWLRDIRMIRFYNPVRMRREEAILRVWKKGRLTVSQRASRDGSQEGNSLIAKI